MEGCNVFFLANICNAYQQKLYAITIFIHLAFQRDYTMFSLPCHHTPYSTAALTRLPSPPQSLQSRLEAAQKAVTASEERCAHLRITVDRLQRRAAAADTGQAESEDRASQLAGQLAEAGAQTAQLQDQLQQVTQLQDQLQQVTQLQNQVRQVAQLQQITRLQDQLQQVTQLQDQVRQVTQLQD